MNKYEGSYQMNFVGVCFKFDEQRGEHADALLSPSDHSDVTMHMNSQYGLGEYSNGHLGR